MRNIVSQSYRGKGIGRMFLETVIEETRKLGANFLSMKTVARNVEAIRFFHKHGFRNLNHIELFIDFSGRKWKKGPRFSTASLTFKHSG